MQLGPRFFLIYLPSNARKIRLADQASFVSRGNQFTTYDARNKWYYSVKRGLGICSAAQPVMFCTSPTAGRLATWKSRGARLDTDTKRRPISLSGQMCLSLEFCSEAGYTCRTGTPPSDLSTIPHVRKSHPSPTHVTAVSRAATGLRGRGTRLFGRGTRLYQQIS